MFRHMETVPDREVAMEAGLLSEVEQGMAEGLEEVSVEAAVAEEAIAILFSQTPSTLLEEKVAMEQKESMGSRGSRETMAGEAGSELMDLERRIPVVGW